MEIADKWVRLNLIADEKIKDPPMTRRDPIWIDDNTHLPICAKHLPTSAIKYWLKIIKKMLSKQFNDNYSGKEDELFLFDNAALFVLEQELKERKRGNAAQEKE